MIIYIYNLYIPIIWPKIQDLSWWHIWFQPDMLLHPWLFCLWRYRYWSKPSNRMNIHLPQCEAPKIAKLVYNSNNYGLWMFMVFITIVTGAFVKPTNITGRPHIAALLVFTRGPVSVFDPDISWCWGSQASHFRVYRKWNSSNTLWIPLVICYITIENHNWNR